MRQKDALPNAGTQAMWVRLNPAQGHVKENARASSTNQYDVAARSTGRTMIDPNAALKAGIR
jgi:hypothetical protein